MEYDVRLEGGPADGDEGRCDGPLPPNLYACFCKGCGDWHWFTAQDPNWVGEVYVKSSQDDAIGEAKYTFKDIASGPSVDERERERDLITA